MEVNIKQEFEPNELNDSFQNLTDCKIDSTDYPSINSEIDLKLDLDITDEPTTEPIKLDYPAKCYESEAPLISSNKAAQCSQKNLNQPTITTDCFKTASRKKCNKCGFLVCNRIEYIDHLLKVHPKLNYYCNDCNYKSVFKKALVRHCKIHRKSNLKCDQCVLTFNTLANLNLHSWKHKKVHSCFNCSFVTSNKCHLEKHLRMHADQEPFSCNVCTFKTPWKREFELHLARHEKLLELNREVKTFEETNGNKWHLPKDRPWLKTYFYCNDCDYKSIFKNALRKHCIVHRKYYFTCDQCILTFRTLTKLNLHIWEHKKDYSCSNCSFVTNNKCHLEEHLRMHAVQEPFNCNVCTFKTPWKRDLELHLVRHNEEALEFIKDEVKTEETKLESHILDNIEVNQCTSCPYQTINKCLFQTHMTRHTSVKPFTCSFCSIKFAWESSLNEHVKQHTLEPLISKWCSTKSISV